MVAIPICASHIWQMAPLSRWKPSGKAHLEEQESPGMLPALLEGRGPPEDQGGTGHWARPLDQQHSPRHWGLRRKEILRRQDLY